MSQRLATQIRKQLQRLIDQYDEQLLQVPGYANLPAAARRDFEQHLLQLFADCLEANDDSRLVQSVHEQAEQVMARGFEPEWLQQAVTIPQAILTPLVETVDESHCVWRSLAHAQTAAWEFVARERRRIELILRENEARYQTIFDSTPVMFWLKDTQNRTLRINKAAAEFEGVKPSDVEGKSAYDLYPREQAEAFYQDDLEVIRSNQPKLGIVEQHTSVGTGKLMWVETGKTPVHNEQGEIIGVLAFGIDVTEREQAASLLRLSAERQQQTSRQLRAALEAASELIQVQDLDTLYRRSVELARERFDVERCGLYMLDESRNHLWGTYGTDDQRRTTDEREAQRAAEEFSSILTAAPEQLWIVRETQHVYVDDGVQHTVGAGWVVATVLRGATGPIGILFNDCAVSGRPIDEAQQEALAIYCSIIGSIIERKRLEERVQQSLALRDAQVQTSTEVAQEIASATNLDELFKRVVTLIKERFNYYHAQLFRYDHAQDVVVLITGYGETGQKMLAAGHQLRMGSGVVGTAAATGRSILASDVRQDADWRPNPYLPDTRGELAVPIKWRDQVLGILDVQSDRANILTDDDRLLLEGLCGQIAIALESTRLLEQLRRNEAQLSEALKIAKLAYWEYDVEKDLFLFNDQFYALFHTTAEQVGGYQISSAQYAGSFVYPDDLPIVGVEIERALNSTDRHYHRNLVHRIRYADGGIGYISVDINIDRDENGKILRYYGANQDITEEKLAELDLRKFKLGLDRSTAAIFITDTNGTITYINPAFEKVYGFTREEAIGRTPRIIKSGLIPQEQYQHFWAALLAGQTVAGEIINRAKDGRLVPVQGSNSAIEDEQGNILGFLALHNDITERKQAEEALRRSQAELSTALHIAKLGYWEYDVEKDLFLFNDQFYAIFHTTAEQAGGYQLSSAQYAQQFVHPDDLPIVGAEIEKALNSTDRHYNRQLEHRIRYADGGVGYISVNINIERDEQGRIVRYYGANQDITQQKLAEQEFARFKQGLEQASDAVFMTDVDGHIIYVNPAFEKIYGYSREEALGQTPRILKSGQLPQEFYQKFWQTLLNKQSMSGEKPNKTKDGRIIIIEDSNSPILDSSGTLLGFLSTHRDITDRKQAEQRMEETLRETERLYAAVSHESWRAYRQTGNLGEGYLFDRALIRSADNVWEPEIAQALEQQVLVTSQSEQRAVTVAPLSVRGEPIGALGVYDDPVQPLSQEDLQLIKAVSEQVALALESARLFDQTQMALADTRALFRFSDLVSRETGIKPIYDSAAQLLVEESGFMGAWIAQVDTQAQVLRGIAGAGPGMGPDRNFDVIPYQHMQTPATIAAREGVMIVVNDPVHDERLSDLPDQMKAVVGKAIAVPVVIDGEIESIIAATRPLDGLDIGERDQGLLQTAAAQIAIAIQRARLFEQTQRDAEREHSLNRIATALSRSSSVNELLPTALNVTLEVIGFECGLATLFDPETDALRIIAQRDLPEGLSKRLETGLGGTLCEYVFIQGQATFLEDMRQGAPLDVSGLVAQGLLSYVGIPLIYQDRVLGTLCMFSHTTQPLGEKMDVLLQSIGQQIGVGVTNARLFEQTQRDAEREHTINRVTSRIRNARSVDEVLAIAAQELRLATQASRSVVEILPVTGQSVRTGNNRVGEQVEDKL
jgi:PAS domain S-box-containing protein